MKSVLSPQTPASGWQARPSTIELETLIQKQFETEVLELTCEKCKVGKEAESAYQVKSLPSILVFHLKRFEVNPILARCSSDAIRLFHPPRLIQLIRLTIRLHQKVSRAMC